MKNLYVLLSLTLLLAASNLYSQNDMLYIWKGGNIINQQSVKTADMDSITFYKPTTYCGNIPDIDGNVYPSVTIGAQCWMQKNLNVSKYRNGDIIPQVQDQTTWATLTTGAWCYYANNTAYGPVYGKLYNWYAVNDPRGLAPVGYHIPTDAEWTTLTDFLGGATVAGGKMKATTSWASPNTAATNSSGFSGLPGGSRSHVGTFDSIGTYGHWWSSSENDTAGAWSRYLFYNAGYAGSLGSISKGDGWSVRCVRD